MYCPTQRINIQVEVIEEISEIGFSKNQRGSGYYVAFNQIPVSKYFKIPVKL